MGGAKPIIRKNPCEHSFCKHAISSVRARVILLSQAARRYRCKHGGAQRRRRAAVLDLDKLYTNVHPMRGDTYWIRALTFAICRRTAVCSPIFVGWHNFEMFAASTKDCYRRYVSVTGF